MKYFKQNFKRQADETDIEDSVAIRPAKKTRKGKKRVPKYMRELKRLTVTAKYLVNLSLRQKLLRFRSKKLKKTYRVYCYDEDLMGWPYRFTKKINKMVIEFLFRLQTMIEILINN